jgi:adenylate cyclase
VRRPSRPPATGEHVGAALRRYEEANARRVMVARTLMFAGIALWVLGNYGPDALRANAGVLALFALLGVAHYALVRGHPERQWVAYLVVVLDVLLLAYTLLAPGRTYPADWPWPMALRQGNFVYFLTILALAALSIRPLLVLWAGLCIALAWTAAAWVIGRSEGAGFARGDFDPDPAAYLAEALDPTRVLFDAAAVNAFVTLVVSLILALAVWRARRLIYDEAEAARERANLARYLAPSMVERLALSDRPATTGEARALEVAVLFADLKGFTALAERLPAGATMELLRAFHGRMADAVFRHRGTLDKFIGDGLMATFGTPEPGPDDAARALACARDMLATVAAWNRERALAGEGPPLEVGIGLHRGPVTAGDIGGADRFEYAVIGDTVNVANRLEHLTREVGLALVASDALRRRAAAEGAEVGDLRPLGARTLRGRREAITVWGLPAPPPPPPAPPAAGPRRAALAGAGVAGLSPED